MPLGNTLNILRPPGRATMPVQTDWNEDLVKNLHNVLGEMSQQITSTTVVSTSSLTSFATKAILEAATVPIVVTSIQLTGYTTDGDSGQALYKRVNSEPSHELKIQSADGAWWEIVPTHIIPFPACGGIAGDDTANGAGNVTAFNNYMSFVKDNDVAGYSAGPDLFFPEGHFHFNDHLNVEAGVRIFGASGWGRAGAEGSKLEWVTDKYGFIIQAHNTLDLTTKASGYRGDGAVIERLNLEGGGNTGSVGSGVWMRARATVKNCYITDFAEDGIRILATAGSGGATEGNANTWRVEGAKCERNGGNGLFTDLADVNAGVCINGDFSQNGRWGVKDSSFLGNTYVGCHVSGNGVATAGGNPSGESAFVHFGGVRYSANVAASEADLVATEPGTDEDVWLNAGAGGSHSTIPTWLVSQSEGTYFHGGPYHSDNANARNVFVGCYNELGQGLSQWTSPTTVFGGFISGFAGSAIVHKDKNIVGRLSFPATDPARDRDVTLVINSALDDVLTIEVEGDHSKGTDLIAWNEADGTLLLMMHANARVPVRFTTDLTTLKGGRSTDLTGGEVFFDRGIFIGAGTVNARHLTNGTAAPSSGEHARGEIVWNRSMVVNDPVGWACTVSGTPGTWVAMANL